MVFVGDISIVFMGFTNQFITFGGHHLVVTVGCTSRRASYQDIPAHRRHAVPLRIGTRQTMHRRAMAGNAHFPTGQPRNWMCATNIFQQSITGGWNDGTYYQPTYLLTCESRGLIFLFTFCVAILCAQCTCGLFRAF